MRSGELAQRGGVSADTLRHYEKRGLLTPPHRGPNGYREYPEAAVHRVRLIQRALDMGFSLTDLARVLRQRDAGGTPCQHVRALAAVRLQELETRIERLTALRLELRTLLREWDHRLASLPPGQRAGLLDALAPTPVSASAERPMATRAVSAARRRRNGRTRAAARSR